MTPLTLIQKIVGILAIPIGWVVLIIPCCFQCWVPVMSSINPFGREPRVISRWDVSWSVTLSYLLNRFYGNREDGVSGAEALVWKGDGLVRVPYRPDTDPRLRAWLWSAWRNSAHELIARPWP